MYTIGDFLIKIQNAYMARKKQVEYPASKIVVAIAKVFEKEGYVSSVKVESPKEHALGKVVIELLYTSRVPAVSKIKLISKPSVHHYVSHAGLSKTAGRFGISIVSTSKGIMSNKQARKEGLGGELICQVR